MNTTTRLSLTAFGGLAALLLVGTSSAAPITCAVDALDPGIEKNYMQIDDSQVQACLASGVGNLQGDLPQDPFLNLPAFSEYEFAGKLDGDPDPNTPNPFNITFSQTGSAGTWGFDSAFWDVYSEGAIGFKFGTQAQTPDQWFVYSLASLIDFGEWEFFRVIGQGGGLSHVNLYGVRAVPEPGTLAILGAGLLGVALLRRRRRLG